MRLRLALSAAAAVALLAAVAFVAGGSSRDPRPQVLRTATFALGWFWESDSQFGSLPGVVRTRVGYAGGTTSVPSYDNIGDYSEAVQVDYDPAVITYEELLRLFWSAHSPTVRPWSSQYASIIFYGDEEERRLAEQSFDAELARTGGPIYTQIKPYDGFTLAEGYHQKYRLQQRPELLAELRVLDPRAEDLLASTAVARLNGYLGGAGDLAALKSELVALGLDPEALDRLLVTLTPEDR